MNTTTLLDKLVEVERALQNSNYTAARGLLLQAEDCVLQIERDMIDVQAEKVRQASRAVDVPIPVQVMPRKENARFSSWSTPPKMFSRALVTTLRTSLLRLPTAV